MRAAIAILMLLGSLAVAHAFSLGLGNRFGKLGSIAKVGPPVPPPAGSFILLVDGTSYILQTDATSKICLAGGC